MRAQQVDPSKIHVLGFPVALEFAGKFTPCGPPAPGQRWRVLFVINSGKREAPHLVRQLLAIEEIDLQITVGRDEALRAEIDAAVAASGRQAEVFGWTDQLPALMCNAHLLISKAGGATVQEALAARTPMLITQVVPGQEEGNARLLIENRCGLLAGSPSETAASVRKVFADDGALWREWTARIDTLRQPDSARDIARFVLSALRS